MSYFKFINENANFDQVNTTTKEFNAEFLYEVLSEFENFLRGCGYVFTGKLDFVEEDEDYGEESNFDDNEEITVDLSGVTFGHNGIYPTSEVNYQNWYGIQEDSITISGTSEK